MKCVNHYYHYYYYYHNITCNKTPNLLLLSFTFLYSMSGKVVVNVLKPTLLALVQDQTHQIFEKPYPLLQQPGMLFSAPRKALRGFLLG